MQWYSFTHAGAASQDLAAAEMHRAIVTITSIGGVNSLVLPSAIVYNTSAGVAGPVASLFQICNTGAGTVRLVAGAGCTIVGSVDIIAGEACLVTAHADGPATYRALLNHTIGLPGAVETLAQTLVAGNVTGGTNIDVNGSDDVLFSGAALQRITKSTTADNQDLVVEVTGATASSLYMGSTGTSTQAIRMITTAGSFDIDSAANIIVDAVGQVNIESTQASAQAIRIFASEVTTGGIDIDAEQGGVNINAFNGPMRFTTNLVAADAVRVETLTNIAGNDTGGLQVRTGVPTATALAPGGQAGDMIIATGTGGATSFAASTGGAGGDLTVTAGNGGVGATGGAGGNITITAGTGGVNTGVLDGNGGSIALLAGGSAGATAGTVRATNFMDQRQTQTISVAGPTALSATVSGEVVAVNTSGAAPTITLPAPAAGLHYRFVLAVRGANRGRVQATGALMNGVRIMDTGGVIGFVNQTNVDFPAAAGAVGDSIEVTCDGARWTVFAYSSVNAGIVTS